MLMAGPANRWPERSIARGMGTSRTSATFLEAAAHSSQVLPSLGRGDSRLFEEGLVDERLGDRQLGHETRNAFGIAFGTHPIEEIPEIRFPVFGILQVGPHVQIVLGKTAQVGYPGDVRSLSRSQLDGEGFLNGLVGNLVEVDFDVGIFRFEAFEQPLHDFPFDSVRIERDVDLGLGESGVGEESQTSDEEEKSE